MAFAQPQATIVITQPSSQNNAPFQQLNGNWNVELMDCFSDLPQCKISLK
jgi:hypothetical protein